MSDKTNYGQSLTHMIKGNLGAGILSMPRSFANLGLVGGLLALPILCLISCYCVHILVKSSRLIGRRLNVDELNYSILARRSFELGPSWLTDLSHSMGRVVDTALLVTQIGVCCVYIVFVVDNVTSILASYHIHLAQSITFLAIFPVTLMLSFIRTLSRLAIASLVANLIQALGLILIVEYLLRDMQHETLRHDNFRPVNEMALGFGSVMFAFEGISVVLPIYNRIQKREQFGSLCGVVNISFLVILALYIIVGLLGYLRYGPHVRDSITLNLPAEPLYDAVRAMFTISILLSYPLQFYVPNEIIWEWSKRNILSPPRLEVELEENQSHVQQRAIVLNKIELTGPMGPGGKLVKQHEQLHTGLTPLENKSGDLSLSTKKPTTHSVAAAAAVVVVGSGEHMKKGYLEGSNITFKGLLNVNEKCTPTNKLDLAPLPNITISPNLINHNLINKRANKLSTIAPHSTNNYGSRVDLINDNESRLSGSSNSSSSATITSFECSTSNSSTSNIGNDTNVPLRYEYLCRILVVLLTFTLAFSVPKLNLLMDLIGSFSGVLLCLVIPSLIHMASYWEKLKGFRKCTMIIVDLSIVFLGLAAGVGGSFSSLIQIIRGCH